MTTQITDQPQSSPRRAFLGATAAGSVALGAGALAAVTPVRAQTAATVHPLGTPTEEIDVASLPRVRQVLVPPPGVPEHEQVASGGPKIVEVEMTIVEKKVEIDDEGTTIWVYAYDGHVPGPLIVAHQGDYIDLTLKSAPENELEHNVDFHSATGAMGAGDLTKIMPGEMARVRFRLLKAGVFVYHCAPGAEMIPYHVCHGMNGAIMVLPRDGLKDKDGNPVAYDRAYFVGEQDYYVSRDADGNFLSYDSAMGDFQDYLDRMRGLIPSHVVFNGRKGALTEDSAMTAKVGETVLVIHAQANRDTRPHLIGAHGDYVWETGSFGDAPATDLETWFIRGGSAGAMMYKFLLPGMYAYVNHNLIEAVLLGAVAHFKVEGAWDNRIMEQLEAPHPM
ncbi:MAG: copper-containing nitrite reductase [Paracoccaceae bacterium]